MVHGLETIKELNRQAVEKSELAAKRAVISMDYPVGLLQIWRFCDDNFRYALDCVQLDFEFGLLEATNGKIAVRHSFTVPDEFRSCGKVVIKSECFEQVAKYVQRRGPKLSMRLVKEGDAWRAEDSDISFNLYLGEGRFPNLQPIFDQRSEQSVSLCLNMHFLAKFCKAFEEMVNCSNEPAVYITIPLDGKATWLRCHEKPLGPTVDARLMPMADEMTPVVKINRRQTVWRKATPEDRGRLARFRNKHDGGGWAYGLLVEATAHTFHCKWSDNNEIVTPFDVCEVEQ